MENLEHWVLVGGRSYCRKRQGLGSCILNNVVDIFFCCVASIGCCICERKARKYIRRVTNSRCMLYTKSIRLQTKTSPFNTCWRFRCGIVENFKGLVACINVKGCPICIYREGTLRILRRRPRPHVLFANNVVQLG